MVKERLTRSNGELNLLQQEHVRRVFPDAFNFARKEERPGSIFVTNLRFVFVSYFKVFSLSLPFFQIRKVSLQKGSSKKKPLLVVSLHRRVGHIKLAFGVTDQRLQSSLGPKQVPSA